jgi:2-methylcitrate dehydratase PrpD
MKETRRLVKYCSSLRQENFSETITEYIRILLLDFLGVAAAGAAIDKPTGYIRKALQGIGGKSEASAFGVPDKIPANLAAFVNAASGNSLELDDTHSSSSTHPGVVIWSSALAVAERYGKSWLDIIPAVIAGYEMTCRVGIAATPVGLYNRGFHPTSTCGVFGSTVAAGSLMGFTDEQMLDAIGIAGSFASGNMEYVSQGSPSKRLQVAKAAHDGVLSATLAKLGYAGPHTILEGQAGFINSYSIGGDTKRLIQDMDQRFEITRTGIKNFGCCRYMHSPMDAALQAIEYETCELESIDEIQVGLVSAGWDLVAEPRHLKYEPKTPDEARFSLPFGVATAILHGRALVQEFSENNIYDETILSLARKVSIHHDSSLDSAFPEKWPSWCQILFKDGSKLSAKVATTKGDPDYPLTTEEVFEKFHILAKMYWSSSQCRKIKETVTKAEIFNISDIMDTVRNPDSRKQYLD